MYKVVFTIVALGSILFAQGNEALVWTAKAPIPAPARCQLQAHGNVRDTIYVCGGRSASAVAINTVNAYVPSTNTWITSLPTMPQPRSHGCGDVIDTVIYAAAGFNASGTPQTTLYAFNVNRKTWATLAPIPSAIIIPAGAASNRRLYVFGSQNSGDTLFEYNPATNTWATIVPGTRPAGRRAAAAGGTATYFYLTGGADRSGAALRDCWRFGGGPWTRMADMPGPRVLHAAYTVVGDSVLYAAGGNSTAVGGNNDSIVYKYTVATNTWTTETPMLTARGFLALDRARDKIYAIGGIKATILSANEEGGPGVEIAENGTKLQNAEIEIRPNPTRARSSVVYQLNTQSKVSLKIYNSSGELVRVLVDNIETAGIKTASFDAAEFANGVYFFKLDTDNATQTGKILLLK